MAIQMKSSMRNGSQLISSDTHQGTASVINIPFAGAPSRRPAPARSNIPGMTVHKTIAAEAAYPGALRPVIDLLGDVIKMPLTLVPRPRPMSAHGPEPVIRRP